MNRNDHHHHSHGQADTGATATPNGIDTDLTDNDPNAAQSLSLDTNFDLSLGAQIDVSAPGALGANQVVTYSGGGFVINVTFDSVLTALLSSDPTLYAAYTGAIQTAVNFYENLITNATSINITFGYGEVNGNALGSGAAGESESLYSTFTYAQFYSAVQTYLDAPGASAVQKAAFATLSATDPTGGNGLIAVSTAEQKVLGLGNYGGVDGYVGISSAIPFSFAQPNTVTTDYDAVGVLEHEISEVMGRTDDLGSTDHNVPTKQDYTPLDFFHYGAAGGASNASPGIAAGVLNEPFVAGYNANVQSYFSYNGTTITLPYDTPAQVAAGQDVADWTNTVLSDSYGSAMQGQTGMVSPADLQELQVLGYDLNCFLPGTQIATPSGEVAVESLRVGDAVLNHRGEAKPVTWIGCGKAFATPTRRNAATPVIVRKGALGFRTPNHDLRITKGHALYIDDVLIPVEFLVNHRSIIWDDRAKEVEAYHVELAVHDVLVANGAPAESYRDDGNRWLFGNANSGWDQGAKPPCAPVLTGGPIVDAIWRRLLDMAGSRPGLPLTDDPDLHILVDGRRVDGVLQPNGAYTFRLGVSPAEVRLVSRAGSPAELGLSRDPRTLGVAVRQIVLWHGRRPTIINADDPRLDNGFHLYEAVNAFRWTNGDSGLSGVLPRDETAPVSLELYINCMDNYPLLDNEQRAAA